MTGLCLDAGALIAVERRSRWVDPTLRLARRDAAMVHVIPEVLAQVWRGGPRQARLAAFLSSEERCTPRCGSAWSDP